MNDSVVKVWIHGITGKLGSLIANQIRQKINRYRVVGGSSQSTVFVGDVLTPYDSAKVLKEVIEYETIDMIFDFSSQEGNLRLLEALEASERTLAVLLGTTGLKAATIARWQKWASSKDRTLLWAPNTSLGIMALAQAARLLRRYLADFDIEISETHHREKADQPSGTALYLAQTLAKTSKSHLDIVSDRNQKRRADELGIHSLRGGSVFGDHTVHFFGLHEDVSVTHRAYHRELFAAGACKFSLWLLQQPPGFFDLDDVDFERLQTV